MKPDLSLSWNKIGKDRLIIILIFGLLLLVILIPTDTIDKTMDSSKEQKSESVMEGITNSGSFGQKTDGVTHRGSGISGSSSGYSETTQYAAYASAQLEGLLQYIDGVGKVKVLVTVKNTPLKIVEKDNPNERNTIYESDSEGGTRNTMELKNQLATVYTVDENGNEVPLIVREDAPDIEGVVVVAQGGGNENVKVHIIEAVEALFGIEPHKIKVVKMKGE